MKGADVNRRLKADDWVLVRVNGSHHQFRKTGVALLITVPHPEKDIPAGTLRNIYRCAGWSWN